MASSDNQPTVAADPWIFRSPPLNDSWIPDAFARETETALTRALQQSLYPYPHPLPSISPSFTASTVTAQSGSGSDPETPGSRRRGTNSNHLGVAAGKAVKRKSRAAKRSVTTFIQTDAANFRQMVQKVTGGEGHVPAAAAVAKPEPHRQTFINRFLPTLDTSAYLLDRQTAGFRTGSIGLSPADGDGDFESFSSFPTLESWN